MFWVSKTLEFPKELETISKIFKGFFPKSLGPDGRHDFCVHIPRSTGVKKQLFVGDVDGVYTLAGMSTVYM